MKTPMQELLEYIKTATTLAFLPDQIAKTIEEKYLPIEKSQIRQAIDDKELNNELLTRSEVAKIFKVSKQVIAQWEKQGIIKRIIIGKTVRFSHCDIIELITLKTNL